MKVNTAILSMIVLSSTSAMAAAAPVQMEEICVKQIQAGVNMLFNGGSSYDNDENPTGVDPKDSASVVVDQVKILSSACLGPAECDAQHPDAFNYQARVTGADRSVTGSVKVYYHRGNCIVESVNLEVK